MIRRLRRRFEGVHIASYAFEPLLKSERGVSVPAKAERLDEISVMVIELADYYIMVRAEMVAGRIAFGL